MPKNTLFNYFTKSPKVEQKRELSSPSVGTVPDNNSKGHSPKEEAKQSRPTEVISGNGKFQLLELVWSKLGGFPFWPSIVCNHPTSHSHIKGKGKKTEIHVQFFDDPPTRSWVKSSQIRPYKGIQDKHAPVTEGDSNWKKAVMTADQALLMNLTERKDLITCTAPSDDDEDDVMDEIDEDDIDYSMANSEKDHEIPKSKRRKLNNSVLSDLEDSEEDYKPGKEESDSESASSGVDENMVSEPESEDPIESPIKKKKRKITHKSSSMKTPKAQQRTLSFVTPDSNGKFGSPSVLTPSSKLNISVSGNTKAKLSLFSASPHSDRSQNDNSSDGKVWTHLKYEWLQDGKRRDKDKRTQDHPDYNSRTLHIPDSVKKTLTPALRQWWEMKADHFDTILFFKVGKFYELYHQDAVIAVNELGLLYMRGEYAHSGFPEIAFSRYADMLIEKGYKVARIEQTETPAMMEERCKKMGQATKYDKVVKREICRVLSKGARTCSFIDGNVHNHNSNYLLAVKEKSVEDAVGEKTQIGVTFIDTTIGMFHIGEFEDDQHRSRFRTLISHYPPSQILMERGNLSLATQQIIETNLSSIIKDVLSGSTEFWTSKKTLKFLSNERYFCDKETCEKNCFPTVLTAMLEEDDALGHTAKPDKDLAIQSFGAIIWYLKNCCIEQELLSMKSFEQFLPIDSNQGKDLNAENLNQQHMVLDGITLQNLDIIENGSTGTAEGTLLQRIDNCVTPFGKRLMRQWLCSPLCNPSSIDDRLNAVEDLMVQSEIASEVTSLMKKLPDLERLLSKIHSQGSAVRSKSHPESRAIFFEATIYSKRKIMDFLSVLEGFKVALEIIQMFSKHSSKFRSQLLQKCIKLSGDNGNFPELKEHLIFFDNAFDHEKAQKDGKIIPAKGVDEEYDTAIGEIKKCEKLLNNYLDEQRKKLQSKITYFGSGKNRFQLEIPEQSVRHLNDDFELQSQRKGFKRYWTPFIKKNLADIMSAEDRRDAALKDIMRRIFEQFDSHYEDWLAAVQCLSVLDVLVNLSNYSKSGDMCRPNVRHSSSSEKPFIEIRNGKYPCSSSYSNNEFIPNDVLIAVKEDDNCPSLVIVTGPNMGGKSTLMRQTGLLIILAQLGCYVPASKCVLSPIDRIFTRLGASDRIMAGESTFFVELNETSSILQHATKHSLVLMDELGRGTATYDGTAIACAVVQELAHEIQCRTLFSTHYHSLVETFSKDSNIQLGHMACMVENENEDDPSQETITFLYKFIQGACPKSYGFNAARLAGLPETIIREGHQKATEFEKVMESRKMFSAIFNATDLMQSLSLL